MSMTRVVTFRAKKLHETNAAFRVVDTATGATFFVPKALIEDPDEPFSDGDEEEISIPHWLAHKEGVGG